VTLAARLVLVVVALLTAAFAFAPPSSGAHLFPWDKADHFCAFFAITTAAVVAFPRASLLVIAAAVSAAGAGIELIQALPFVARDCDVMDWMAENAAIAAVFGVIFAADIRRGGRPISDLAAVLGLLGGPVAAAAEAPDDEDRAEHQAPGAPAQRAVATQERAREHVGGL
jgi:hypothetical protein